MSKKKIQEKRKFPRFKISQLIEISFGREEYLNAAGVNLSEGGLRCETDRSLDLYSQVYLMFELTLEAGAEPIIIKTEGVVIHSQEKSKGGYRVGVQFTGLAVTDQDSLKKYLETKKLSPA